MKSLIKYLLILSLSLGTALYAKEPIKFSLGFKDNKTVYRDFLLASSAITAWGVNKWDWFHDSPKIHREGWFGANTATGGSDKTGHMFTTFFLSEILIWDFRRNNIAYAEEKAALTSIAAMTLLEVGDSTSRRFGFSPEDLIADSLGAGTSYLLAKHPDLDNKIDFRIEYTPSKGSNGKVDQVADYSGMKHLFAIKGSGFKSLQHTPLKYLEIHLGYYTRGYRSYDKGYYEKSRNPYVAIGINIQRVFNNKPITRFLEYYQPPGTYVEF